LTPSEFRQALLSVKDT
jgi:hypothetical protein